VLIFALVAVLLAADQFPASYPGLTPWRYALAGIVVALVFFGGLLAHELSHAVVARRQGRQVDGITLWMFGGVTRLRGEPRTPGDEARTAAAGPLVSLLLALLFITAAVLMTAVGWTGLPVGAVTWLAAINLLLAVFNLLPAAPLDGGRLLRAAVWRWRGDRDRATVVAARTGRVLGAALIGLGCWQYLVDASVSGVWTALIGWFVLAAAFAEEQSAVGAGALAVLLVAEVMSEHPQTLPPHLTVTDLIDTYLWSYRHSAFPLVENGHVVGLVTLGRVKRVPADRRTQTSLLAISVPPDELVLARPEDPLVDLLTRLRDCPEGRALVLDDEHQLVGIVTPSDLSRALQNARLVAGRLPSR